MEIELEILGGNLVVAAHNGALEQAPHVFYTVGANPPWE